MHDDVAALDHAKDRAAPGGRAQVDRDASLVAIEGDERRAHSCVRIEHFLCHAEVARLVAAARFLDLDHIRAEVAEDLRGRGPREHARQVENAYAGKYVPHGRSS